jgi:hypothetical protein
MLPSCIKESSNAAAVKLLLSEPVSDLHEPQALDPVTRCWLMGNEGTPAPAPCCRASKYSGEDRGTVGNRPVYASTLPWTFPTSLFPLLLL